MLEANLSTAHIHIILLLGVLALKYAYNIQIYDIPI